MFPLCLRKHKFSSKHLNPTASFVNIIFQVPKRKFFPLLKTHQNSLVVSPYRTMSSFSDQKQANSSTLENIEDSRSLSPVPTTTKIEELVKHESPLSLKKNISWLSNLPHEHSNAPVLISSNSLQKVDEPCVSTAGQGLDSSYSSSLRMAETSSPPSLEIHVRNESMTSKSTKRARSQRKVKIEVEKDDKTANHTSTEKKLEIQARSRDEKFSVPEPENWKEIWELLEEMRMPGGVAGDAPVDSMGCGSLADEAAEPKVQRFQTLISLMLSSQTRDETNSAAISALKKLPGGLTPQSLIDNPEEDVHKCIKFVSFHNTKIKNIILAARTCIDKYDSDIPPTIEALCELKGVGPKMGHLCMQIAWKEVTGIGVDVHVHRITNRFKWHNTKDPEGSRKALESWLPKERWEAINVLLVGLGQMICPAINPKCNLCSLAENGLCPSSSLKKKKQE